LDIVLDQPSDADSGRHPAPALADWRRIIPRAMQIRQLPKKTEYLPGPGGCEGQIRPLGRVVYPASRRYK
jgi:hypothetical protein